MAITFTPDPDFPVRPEKPYLVEDVTITTTGGTTSGDYTSRLNRPEKVVGNVSWSISGNVVSVANLPANAVYTISILGK